MTRILIAALLALLPLTGGGLARERGGVLDAIALSGSPAIAIHALSVAGLPAPYRAAGDALIRSAGLTESGAGSGSSWIGFKPVLTYDGNVNGGAAGDAIVIDGFRFEVTDRYRAVGGMLVGASMSSGAKIGFGGRTALELGLEAFAAWSPERQMTKTSISGSVCLRHMMVDRSTYPYGCLDGYYLGYDLGETQRAGGEIGVGRVFTTGSAFHEFAASIRHERDFLGEGRDQTILTGRYTGAFANGWTLSAGVGLGTEIEERVVMRERLGVSGARIIAGRPTSFMLSLQRNRGGLFLGEARDERVTSLGVGRQVTDGLTVRATASRTDAKHGFFNDTAFGLDLGFRF